MDVKVFLMIIYLCWKATQNLQKVYVEETIAFFSVCTAILRLD